MEKGDMGVPCWGGVRSVPKRMIAREPTVVRSSLVDEDKPARSRRVPRVRRNHVQRGLQLSFEQFSHSITPPELSNMSPMSGYCQNRGDNFSLDSMSYAGSAIASYVRHHDSCWRSRMSWRHFMSLSSAGSC